jgi:hypothetical protein
MNDYRHTVVNLTVSAISLVGGWGNNVNGVSIANQSTGKAFCESSRTIDVRWKSVAADYNN